MGLDKMTPAQAQATFKTRAVGQALSAGLPSDYVKTVLGGTEVVNTGGAQVPMRQIPIAQGGGLSSIPGAGGQAIPQTLAPQVADATVPGTGAPYKTVVGGAYGVGDAGGASNGAPTAGGVPPGPALPGPSGPPSNARISPQQAVQQATQELGAGLNSLPPEQANAAVQARAQQIIAGASSGAPQGGPTPALRALVPPGQSPSDRVTAEAQAKGGADVEDQMNDAARGLPVAIQRVQTLVGALQTAQAGGGAEMRTRLGGALQALQGMGISGITNGMISQVANGSLPASQVFNSTILSQAISQLAQDNKGNGKAFRPEIDAALQAKGLSNDPQALLQLLNNTLQTYQVTNDQAMKYSDFTSDPAAVAKYGKNGFYRWYNGEQPEPGLIASGGGDCRGTADCGPAGLCAWARGPDSAQPREAGGRGAVHPHGNPAERSARRVTANGKTGGLRRRTDRDRPRRCNAG